MGSMFSCFSLMEVSEQSVNNGWKMHLREECEITILKRIQLLFVFFLLLCASVVALLHGPCFTLILYINHKPTGDYRPFGSPPTNVYNLALAVVLLIVIVVSGLFTFFQVIMYMRHSFHLCVVVYGWVGVRGCVHFLSG
jgi:uncharacterized BrkB/YihY/UPF0761 family membrane protein